MKKNLFKICIVLMGVSLVACLDDDKYALDPEGTKNVIEFFDPSVPASPVGSIYPVWVTTTEIVPNFEFEQTISYSGPNSNSKNIELTLAVDELALDEYNAQMEELGGAHYEMMPDAYYEFTDLAVTIPKGEKKVNISMNTHPNLFDLTKNFALPIRITSASDGILSTHWSVAILAVVVKNKYDGRYKIIDGNIQRNSATGPDPALSGDYIDGLKVDFITKNGNTNAFTLVWKNGGGIAGIDNTKVVINESSPNPDGTLPITVSSDNPAMVHIPGEPNYYDPATKTFKINVQWGSGASTRVVTNYTAEYLEPRP